MKLYFRVIQPNIVTFLLAYDVKHLVLDQLLIEELPKVMMSNLRITK